MEKLLGLPVLASEQGKGVDNLIIYVHWLMIALFVGWYMYRLRPGRVIEASVIGATAVLAATVAGNWIPGSPLEPYFALSRTSTIVARSNTRCLFRVMVGRGHTSSQSA